MREDILPSMASNRKVQRLLNEFMDLLSEYETAETNLYQKNSKQPTASQPETNEMDLDQSASDHKKSTAPVTDKTNCVQQATDQKTPLASDQEDSGPILTDQVIPDSLATDTGP